MQLESDASAAGGALWLTRAKDVVAHLFFAAAEISHVLVDHAGTTRSGTLSFPDVERRRITVTLDAVAGDPGAVPPSPAPGTVVRLRYFRGDAAYAFLTSVVATPAPAAWALEFPTTIERNERRIARRQRVLGVGGFRARLHLDEGAVVLPIFDLSTAGVGLVFDPARIRLLPGRSLPVTLVLPSGDTVPALVEISNVRDLPGGSAERVAGCRFLGLSPADLAKLAEATRDAAR